MADNYLLQMQAAQRHFLTYDQEKLIRKFSFSHDENWLYPVMLGQQYRLCRKTGRLEKRENGSWCDANTFGQVMTLLDLLCDSREDRFASGEFTSMQNLGGHVHSRLLESPRDPLALRFDKAPAAMKEVCLALGARPVDVADLAFSFPLFEELTIQLRFWHSDEDFPASIRWFWDKNALMYLRYETTYFLVDFLRQQLQTASECAMIHPGDEENGAQQ